ncbi:MAG: ABC transporter substrate-binding protein [Conexibacteraceae bacterium]|nr:ABC transporter substrate-binding protein [Conexibacteraceae bacterium]
MQKIRPAHPGRHRLKWVSACALSALAIAGGASTSASATPRSFNGVPLPQAAERIVSLTDAATEDLFAIGAGKQVVAADEFSTYPKNAPTTKLSAIDPNAEAIATYRPDLVVIADNVRNIGSQLAALHIPVLYLPAPANLNGAYAQMRQLGAVTGRSSQAAALVSHLQHRVAGIVKSVRRTTPPITVYHELDQTYYSASSRTFVGQIYSLLGLRNIADKAPKATAYPQLSGEYIVSADPDMIVLADTVCCGQSVKTVARRPGWNQIAAVKDRDVLAVNDTVASEWGPRIVDFLAEVAREMRRVEAQRR